MIAALVGAALLLAPAGTETVPKLQFVSNSLVLQKLPAVLSDEGVRKHLTTGLTATFVFEVELRDGSKPSAVGAAQISVRLDLWDDRFILTVHDLRGERHAEAAGASGLQTWWNTTTLELARAPTTRERPGRARVRLVVLPFSRAEEEDTRTWFLRSLQRQANAGTPAAPSGDPGRVETGPVASRGEGTLGQIYTLLMATSIGRRSLITYTWDVPVREAPP